MNLVHFLDAEVAKTDIPSISVCIYVDGQQRFSHTAGMARISPPQMAIREQVYDLASLTKVLVGTSVAASLVADGTLDPNAPVAAWLPAVDGRITMTQLLQHSSGALWWKPYYELAGDDWGSPVARERILHAAQTEPLTTEPGTAHRYSDTGFLIMAALLEAAGGAPLDQLFHNRIRIPAAVEQLWFGYQNAAATEVCPVQGRLIQGSVHDLNCAAMGGVSAHAGLFGTASAVAALGSAMLESASNHLPHHKLPGKTLATFWTSEGIGSHAMGWDRISEGYTSTGSYFPKDSIGHLGFTGCSLWMSPSRHTAVALLTNRIHPKDAREAIRAARPRIHDAVSAFLGWK